MKDKYTSDQLQIVVGVKFSIEELLQIRRGAIDRYKREEKNLNRVDAKKNPKHLETTQNRFSIANSIIETTNTALEYFD